MRHSSPLTTRLKGKGDGSRGFPDIAHGHNRLSCDTCGQLETQESPPNRCLMSRANTAPVRQLMEKRAHRSSPLISVRTLRSWDYAGLQQRPGTADGGQEPGVSVGERAR